MVIWYVSSMVGGNNLLTVSQAATEIGVSVDTIRRWDKKGLVKTHRSEINHRLFSIDDIKLLHKKVIGASSDKEFRVLKSRNKTEYQVVELFAGAGGTALGFENAGLEHKILVEVDSKATATLRQNRPKWNVVENDVVNIDFTKIDADVVEGGFPCQTFSYAGKKRGFGDVRGTLFFEFARAVKEIRPKIAVAENVKGLMTHDNGDTLKTIIRVLRNLGYKVAFKILRAQYLDVAQKRERLVIIGVRNDLDVPIVFPKEQGYIVSLREVLKNVPKSSGQEYPDKKKRIMDLIPPGGYWRDLPINLQKEYMKTSFYMGGGKTGMARRLSWGEPSLTLTCAPAQKQTERCHPDETRPLRIREYARIQSFPDSWKFEGSISSKYKQIGNAVPVNLGYHIGRCVIAMLNNKINDKTMEVVEPVLFNELTLFN